MLSLSNPRNLPISRAGRVFAHPPRHRPKNRFRFLESTMPRPKQLERPLCVRPNARRSKGDKQMNFSRFFVDRPVFAEAE
ncbi:MAG: hypothetical protein EAS49_14195, partial [Brucella intermedia]